MKTKTYYVLPAEMADGVSRTVTDDKNAVIAGVTNWLNENPEAESITIEARQMTEEQVAALPEL
jgi:hypothetical protein